MRKSMIWTNERKITECVVIDNLKDTRNLNNTNNNAYITKDSYLVLESNDKNTLRKTS